MTNHTAARAGWRQTARLYADARMAKVLFLGFISGFPWLLIGSMVSLWLKEEGLSRTGIGLFGLVFGVYAINALWAPLVDGVRIPFLTARLGRRRAWLVAMQGVMVCAMAGMYALPSAQGNLWWVAFFAFVIALASATQDVAIDATRIEMFGKDEPQKVGAGSAMATSGWWLGFGGGKALVFPFVQWMQGAGVANAWQAGYLALTPAVALCIVGVVLYIRIPEGEAGGANPAAAPPPPPETMQEAIRRAVSTMQEVARRAAALYVAPIASFCRNYTLPLAAALLAFIFFFKIGEAFLGRMSLVFYKEIGFSTSQIGLLSGGLGTITVCVFAVFGGFVNARYGLFWGIVLGGVAMAATNLLFALLAWSPERWLFVVAVVAKQFPDFEQYVQTLNPQELKTALFAVAVVADQFTTAVSTVAFVAFLSQLCDRAHTATQYAALASVGNLARTTLATASGALVDGLGGNWQLFFLITVLMAAPGIAILFAIRRPLAPILTGAR